MNSPHLLHSCYIGRVQTELWKSKMPSIFGIDCCYNTEHEIWGEGYKPDRKPQVPCRKIPQQCKESLKTFVLGKLRKGCDTVGKTCKGTKTLLYEWGCSEQEVFSLSALEVVGCSISISTANPWSSLFFLLQQMTRRFFSGHSIIVQNIWLSIRGKFSF